MLWRVGFVQYSMDMFDEMKSHTPSWPPVVVVAVAAAATTRSYCDRLF